ncbi:MAG: pyridoxamine 5'-phosphate oxidase family protein [Acidobacteria bacterium]|nr:pyridoxamine 5'-phosphate oxidase family protein [Acidobacteriota bacterium]
MIRLFLALALAPILGAAPPAPQPLAVARELSTTARYCSLVTLDAGGSPDARLMDAFPMEADGTVWLATTAASRKVGQIRRDPRVSLLWFEAGSQSYVALVGRATLVVDPVEKARRWKPDWKDFYPGGPQGPEYVLIRVQPRRLEISSPARGLHNDERTWKPVTVEFP